MRSFSSRTLLCAVVTALVLMGTIGSASAYEFIATCNTGKGVTWPAADLPLGYYINTSGSDDMSASQLSQIIDDSFEAWATPCNSSFRSSYVSTTPDTAIRTNKKVVLSWAETRSTWPQQLGDPFGGTIAVTLTTRQGCSLIGAPIIFNGVAIRYTDQCGANFCQNQGTDLQSIATHEIGHMLGLDHSPQRAATMYYAYQPGNVARSLAGDDLGGVSALYPRTCSCTADSQCSADNEKCINGTCQDVPCTNDSVCDLGEVCNTRTGDCEVPPCTDNVSCGPGFRCDAGTCRSQCPVCRDCTDSNQCGANAVCADTGGQGKCIVFCSQNGDCPGDGVCFGLQQDGQTYQICLNSDANQAGLCPATYICQSAPTPTPVDPCEMANCNEATQICQMGRCVARETTEPEVDPTDPDMGTDPSPNPDPDPIENNTPSPSNNSTGGRDKAPGEGSGGIGNELGQGSQDDDYIIIVPEPQTQESTCAAAPRGTPSRVPLLLVGLLGLVGIGARKKKR